jgi:hypothetical protein
MEAVFKCRICTSIVVFVGKKTRKTGTVQTCTSQAQQTRTPNKKDRHCSKTTNKKDRHCS